MIVEVTGTSTTNKGAELMLLAIAEHYAPAADVALAVTWNFGTPHERAQYGLRTKLEPPAPFGSRRARYKAVLMQRVCRGWGGRLTEADIAGVIDASGFAFGDQLDPNRTFRFANNVIRWKQQGKPVVLLPQALGPFETPREQQRMRQVVEHADLIYARDPVSLEHVRQLAGEAGKVRMAPDFTCLVEGTFPDEFEPRERRACIVPNHRMIEKTSAADRDRYIPFLAACLREVERRDLSPYVLLHDTGVDESLVRPLEQEYGRSLSVVRERDPRRLKGILGTAHIVIGSRFHALVGALSQAVPSVAVGWSHKYPMLLADYGCPESVLNPSSTDAEIRDVIGLAVDESSRGELIGELKRAGLKIKEEVRTMWREVDRALGVSSGCNADATPSMRVPVAGVHVGV